MFNFYFWAEGYLLWDYSPAKNSSIDVLFGKYFPDIRSKFWNLSAAGRSLCGFGAERARLVRGRKSRGDNGNRRTPSPVFVPCPASVSKWQPRRTTSGNRRTSLRRRHNVAAPTTTTTATTTTITTTTKTARRVRPWRPPLPARPNPLGRRRRASVTARS